MARIVFFSEFVYFYLSIIVFLSSLYVPDLFSDFGGHFLLDVDIRTKDLVVLLILIVIVSVIAFASVPGSKSGGPGALH